MTYSDFTLDALRHSFQLAIQQLPLFPHVNPVEVPAWLQEALQKGIPFALTREKARSEFIIAPILLTSRDLFSHPLSIHSGRRLDSAPERDLSGECDFIVTLAPPLPVIQTPIITLVEAKKNDIEASLGPCAAQTLGALLFNQKENTSIDTVYGCTTTGAVWQFLKLDQNTLYLDERRYYIDNVGLILGVLLKIYTHYQPLTDTGGL